MAQVNLAPSVAVDADGDDYRHRDDPPGLADLHMRRIDPETGPVALDRAIKESLDPFDVLPKNPDNLDWNFPLMIPGSGRGEFHEGIEVHGGADRLRSEAGRGWRTDRRGLLKGWHHRRDVLQLAQDLCGADAVGDEAVAAARG